MTVLEIRTKLIKQENQYIVTPILMRLVYLARQSSGS